MTRLRFVRGVAVFFASGLLAVAVPMVVLFMSFLQAPAWTGPRSVLNGLWAGHDWVAENHSESDYQNFASLLRTNRISDVFFHCGPISGSGSVPTAGYPDAAQLINRLKRYAPDVRAQAWIGFEHRKSDDLDLGSESTRRRMVAAAGELLRVGFAGIHLDIEPVVEGDPHFLNLLDALHQRTRLAKAVLSVATPTLAVVPEEQLVGALVHGYDHWSMNYYRQASSRADQIAVMAYDTGMPTDWLYGSLVEDQTVRLGEGLAPDTSLFIGAPTYNDRTWLHHPTSETLRASIRGVEKGIARLAPANRRRVGLAVYAEWTSTGSDWSEFRQAWLS